MNQSLYRNWSTIYQTIGDHPWSGTKAIESIWSEVESLNPQPKTVLDVGCGEGDKSRWFAEKGFTVVGIDASSHAIASAKKLSGKLPIKYHEIDMLNLANLALPKSSFGIVFDSSSSQFLPSEEQEKYFRLIEQLLSKNGCLIYNALDPIGPDAPSWISSLGITRSQFLSLIKNQYKQVMLIDRPSRNLSDVSVFGGLFTPRNV